VQQTRQAKHCISAALSEGAAALLCSRQQRCSVKTGAWQQAISGPRAAARTLPCTAIISGLGFRVPARRAGVDARAVPSTHSTGSAAATATITTGSAAIGAWLQPAPKHAGRPCNPFRPAMTPSDMVNLALNVAHSVKIKMNGAHQQKQRVKRHGGVKRVN